MLYKIAISINDGQVFSVYPLYAINFIKFYDFILL